MRYITALAIAALLTNSAAQFTYEKNGEDFVDVNQDCAKDGQSPIKLQLSGKFQGVDNAEKNYKKIEHTADKFSSEFGNQKDARVRWFADRTTKVDLVTAPNRFTSQIAKDEFGSTTADFEATEFIFRAASEHRILQLGPNQKLGTDKTPELLDGQAEVEMQIIAVPKELKTEPPGPENPIKGAAIAILFDTVHFNTALTAAEQLVIDTFFDTLDLANEDDPTVNFNTFGDIMSLIDMNNRWVYRGTRTEPPCEGPVIWNVLRTVYPIKKHHMDLIRKQRARGENGNMKTTGNWRAPADAHPEAHAPVLVTDSNLGAELATTNDINYNININIYNQNVGGKGGKCKDEL